MRGFRGVIVPGGGGGGGGGITNIKVSAGTLSALRSDITFDNGNGVSFGLETNGIITATVRTDWLSTQSNQALSGSNGSFTFQTATFGNLNGLSFYTSNGSLVGSYTVPTQTNQTLGLYAVGNTVGESSSTTRDARSLSFVGQGIISVGFSNGSVNISANAGGGGLTNIKVSAGTLSALRSDLTFGNANNFSFGLETNGVITGSYTVPTVTNSSWTVSDNATSGTVARLAFTNLNGVTLSLSSGAGGSHTIVGSHNALTSQSNQAASGSNGSFTFQTLTFGNLNGLSFYTSNGSIVGSYTDAGGGGGGATVSQFPPWPQNVVNPAMSATIHSGASGGTGGSTQWTYSGRLWPVDICANIHWAELQGIIGPGGTVAGTGSATMGIGVGIYTLNANTVLSLVTSYVWTHAMSQNSVTARSHQFGWGTNSTSNSSDVNGNVSASFSGTRIVMMNETNETLTPGRYYFLHVLTQRTSGANVYQISSLGEWTTAIGINTSTLSFLGRGDLSQRPGHWGGVISTTTNTPAISFTALPGSIHTSAITRSDASSRWRIPWFMLQRSVT